MAIGPLSCYNLFSVPLALPRLFSRTGLRQFVYRISFFGVLVISTTCVWVKPSKCPSSLVHSYSTYRAGPRCAFTVQERLRACVGSAQSRAPFGSSGALSGPPAPPFVAQHEMQVVFCCALPIGEESHILPLHTSALKFPQFQPRAGKATDGAEFPVFTLSVDLSFQGSHTCQFSTWYHQTSPPARPRQVDAGAYFPFLCPGSAWPTGQGVLAE